MDHQEETGQKSVPPITVILGTEVPEGWVILGTGFGMEGTRGRVEWKYGGGGLSLSSSLPLGSLLY